MEKFEPSTQIQNADRLTIVFDGWPSFHDAEILSIRLDRGEGSPFLEADFHVFQMTKDVDERGYFILKNHMLATIRFENFVLHEMKWFNHQNSIDGLEIGSGKERRFGVSFPSNWGCEADFECDQMTVVSVAAYTPRQVSSSTSITMEPPKPC